MIANNQNCLLSAGHCCADTDWGPPTGCPFRPIVEFNVPLSQSNRVIVPSLPEDQYPLHKDSVQHHVHDYPELSDDWCYFGVVNNAITGLSPYAAQGSAYELAETVLDLSGSGMRISGYGTAGGVYQQTLQTRTGDFDMTPNSSFVRVEWRTWGGESGSAMEYDGLVYGILTNQFCTNNVGWSLGTPIDNSYLQSALANGWGVCEDCNHNTIPDLYEVEQQDCNENLVPDDCDITNQTSEDCDENGVPDECQSLGSCCIQGETCFECMTYLACRQLDGNWGDPGDCMICAMRPVP